VDHLPLYRQSEIYAREGVSLERSTMADWIGEASRLLQPLVSRLRQHIMAANKVHADDTPIAVLAPGQGKTKTGRLWTYVRDERPAGSSTPPAVWFAYSPDRKGEHPRAHLRGFAGTLQADGYAGFAQLYASGTIHEAACWAHARRKFFDLHKALCALAFGQLINVRINRRTEAINVVVVRQSATIVMHTDISDGVTADQAVVADEPEHAGEHLVKGLIGLFMVSLLSKK